MLGFKFIIWFQQIYCHNYILFLRLILKFICISWEQAKWHQKGGSQILGGWQKEVDLTLALFPADKWQEDNQELIVIALYIYLLK